MANIIPYDDTPIVDEKELAKTHEGLVTKLKESLFVGNAGFIKAGQFLTEIREGETYKAEDSTREVTFKEFCARPDIPISGATEDGRVRNAQRLMSVWKTIASQPNVDEKQLAEIGYSKLAVVASVINKDPKAKLDEWLAKAQELTAADLQSEVNDGGKTLAEANACEHENYHAVDAWRCDDCKRFLKDEPGKEKKDDKKKK